MRIYAIFLFCCFLVSCKCRNSCYREGACRTFTIKLKSNDSLVLSKTYCTTSVNYSTFQDSVKVLLEPYPLRTYIINYTDDGVTSESHIVDCDDVGYFEQQRYFCQSQK